MKTKNLIVLLCVFTIAVGTFTACGKTASPTNSNPTEATSTKNQIHEDYKNGMDTQHEDDTFTGPYYGTIKKVDSTSIEIDLLSIENETNNNASSNQSLNDGDTQKLDQQAQKTEKPVDFQSNGEVFSATFAPTFQISNAGKTVLDLKEGDMIAFYTNSSDDKEIVSINIMG